ncbi:MAG TPA: J domain-containing protein [Candidatus Limnocylindria bacterium]|nr:J domain-containing protein [Candidatus Limnocylindria bacterium]
MQRVHDPYRTLGVSRGATDAEIKAAHRRLAKRYHPDARQGDTLRFLHVQEAYLILSNPLRRREWDARHAAGPVRASDPGSAPRSRSRRSPPADTDEPGQRRRPRPAAAPREPAARSYTWSASEVPWWEEGSAQARRSAAGRRERTSADGSGPEAAVPPPRPEEADRPQADPAQADFNVYDRSSGAAWSMAARAYFRRDERDLPRRGSFRHAGSVPLTAARARAAAEHEARARPAPQAAATGRPPAGIRPAAGVATDAARINRVRQVARERAAAARWPSLAQRLWYALLAWLPIVLLAGYGGSVATGCDRGAPACPENFELLAATVVTLALGLLLLLPRLAYVAATATIGLAAGAGVLALFVWAFGLRPPLPLPVIAIVAVVLLLIYLLSASLVVAGRAGSRPWSGGAPR